MTRLLITSVDGGDDDDDDDSDDDDCEGLEEYVVVRMCSC